MRTASLLLSVVETAIEVGPGASGLPSTLDEPPGQGPLAGVAAGCRALRALGHGGGALVVACDLPFLSATLLRFLVEWDSSGSLVPVVRGIPQPLCARWGARDLDSASDFLARGRRSLWHLTTQPGVVLLDESGWKDVASEEQFFDVDSPDDWLRLGLATKDTPAASGRSYELFRIAAGHDQLARGVDGPFRAESSFRREPAREGRRGSLGRVRGDSRQRENRRGLFLARFVKAQLSREGAHPFLRRCVHVLDVTEGTC